MGRHKSDESEIIGIIKNNLKIISFDHRDNHGIYYKSECIKCHRIKLVRKDNFMAGKCSCEYCRNKLDLNELEEDIVIGDLKLLDYYTYPNKYNIYKETNGRTYVICECSCGKICAVLASNYFSGMTTSCGHKRKEYSQKFYNGRSDTYYDNRPDKSLGSIAISGTYMSLSESEKAKINVINKQKEEDSKNIRIRPKYTYDDKYRVRKRNQNN